MAKIRGRAYIGRSRGSSSILLIFVLIIVVIFYSSSCHKDDIVRPRDEGPELSAHPDSFEITAEAGIVDLNIENTGDPTLEWEIATEAAWLSLSTESGSGDGTVEISYQENANSESRNTEIVITRCSTVQLLWQCRAIRGCPGIGPTSWVTNRKGRGGTPLMVLYYTHLLLLKLQW